jgi:hypothetical protein
MRTYRNLSGNSGVVAYQTGKTYIRIKFVGGDVYTYNYEVTGIKEVEKMKDLALKGKGLSSYISEVVKTNYAFKG